MYNPKFYEFVEVDAPVYELNNNGEFVLVKESYTGRVPTLITVREANKFYENVLKEKIHSAIEKEKHEAFDKNFEEISCDGKTAIMYGFSARAIMEIDTKKYMVEFLRKDSLGDFEIKVTKK